MSSTPSQPDLQKETLWRERLSAQAASGLGVRDGCRQQGDSDSLFHFWKSTLAKRDGTYTPPPRKAPAPSSATKAQPAFAQVVVNERQTKKQATAAPPQSAPPPGGRAAAVLFSLVQSARRHGIDPFVYLRDLRTRLPSHPQSRIAELLPDRGKLLAAAAAAAAARAGQPEAITGVSSSQAPAQS